MIERRSSGVASLHTLLVGVEAALWWIALAAAVPMLRSIPMLTTLLPRPAYPVAIALSLVFSMGAAARAESSLVTPGWAESMRLAFRQIAAVTCAVFTLVVGMKDPGMSRLFLAIYLPTTAALFVVLNRLQPAVLVRLLYGRRARIPTLVMGDPELFPELTAWLKLRARFGLEPVGVVGYHGRSPSIPGLELVGDFADLKSAIARSGARQLLMLNLPASARDSEALARVCASCGCRLLIHNNLTFQLSYPLRVLAQDGYSFLAFQDEPLENPLNRTAKRALDIAVAIPVVLFVLPPLAVLVWLVQRRQSAGPLFYRQARSGRGGVAFQILKFRTMTVAAAEECATSHVPERVYPFGRFLRRTSLDELPQFLNVLAGDMSVVGPRPHFVRHDDLFADAVNEYRVRFFVKPGITGLAQSRGFRGEMHSPELIQQRVRLDLAYIHNWSVWLDLAIIARTFQQLISPPPSAQ